MLGLALANSEDGGSETYNKGTGQSEEMIVRPMPAQAE
jgi:hypothetical protein